MPQYLVKYAAARFCDFGIFLGCEERAGWVEAMNEGMEREYGERRGVFEGRAIMYDVFPEPCPDQAAFDAYKKMLHDRPVVNVEN